MAMERLEVTWNDPRTFGSEGRRKRSAWVLRGDLEKLFEAVHNMRWGHGFRVRHDSPTAPDTLILGYNHTGNDLMFGALISGLIGAASSVTWKLQQGDDLTALADIVTLTTDSDTLGNTVPPSDLDALDAWEAGHWLVLVVTATTGTPEQLVVDMVIDS